MSVQITFNKKTFAINTLPYTLKGLKTEIIRGLGQHITTTNFDIKASYLNKSRKIESALISTETQYKAFLKKLPANLTQLSIEVVPVFTPQEKRDVVTIEDEKTHTVHYVDFRRTDDSSEMSEEEVQPKAVPKTQAKSSPLQSQKKTPEQRVPVQKTAQQTAPQKTTKPASKSAPYKGLEYTCNGCSRMFPGRIKYGSTAIEDYYLCEECFSEMNHPYTMIEYIDGKPVRKIEPPRNSGYHRSTPRYGQMPGGDFFNFPSSFGRPRTSGFDNFFSMF